MQIKIVSREWFVRTLERLSRISRTRGFGVQSPWAYQFLQEVVRGKGQENKCQMLMKQCETTDPITIKLAQLCFRLAANRQPTSWCFKTIDSQLFSLFVKTACPESEIHLFSNEDDIADTSHCRVLVIDLVLDWEKFFNSFVEHAAAESLFFITHIHASKVAFNAWKAMQKNDRTGVSFDLYDCGLLFFDKKMYKRSYKVNL